MTISNRTSIMHTRLQHLLTIADIPTATCHALLQRAQHIIDHEQHRSAVLNTLNGITLVNLFFEASTRTRASFELAAQRLGAYMLSPVIQTLSIQKQESILDTVTTLGAMHCQGVIIRHSDDHLAEQIADSCGDDIHIINAGSGTYAHPTQALLDALTISQVTSDWSSLKIVIVGDIAHSRVARSGISLFRKLGVTQLHCVAPRELLPEQRESDVHYSHDLEQALEDADVIMMLRIQLERLANSIHINVHDYHHKFGLTSAKLALAKPDAIVLHPGPVNRDVEIATNVMTKPQTLILRQIENGVAMRMAVLEHIFANN